MARERLCLRDREEGRGGALGEAPTLRRGHKRSPVYRRLRSVTGGGVQTAHAHWDGVPS